MSSRLSAYFAFRSRYGVPSDWNEARVRDVVDIVGGGTPDTSQASYWDGDIPWLTPTEMTSLSTRLATTSVKKLTAVALKNSNCVLLPVGALVLSTRGTIGLVARAGVPLTCNQSCEGLLPKSGYDSDYLYYLLSFIRPILERFGAGTTFSSITRRDFRDIRIGVASPDEQKTIAAILIQLDELMAAAETRLIAAKQTKSALFQSLLTNGIPGRHTSFSTVKIFRHQIQVPKDWEVERLKLSLAAIEYGTNAASNDGKFGLPVVAIPQVVAPRLRLGQCSFVELPPAESEALRLAEDDVLLVRTNGNPDYIGKSTVVGKDANEQHFVYASYLIRVRTDKSKLSGRYLNYFLASPLGRRQCLAMANTSAGNHNLGARSIRQFCIPRPATQEQNEIVDLIDAAQDSIENAEVQVESLVQLRRTIGSNLLTGKLRVRV